MPEGHSIRRLADQWEVFIGQRLSLSSPQERFSEEAALLDQTKLVQTHAHGKHLFLEFEHKRYIHVHLGLYGRFTWHRRRPVPAPKPTARLRAETSTLTVDLSGPTKCELITEEQKQAIHARLGPDPLHPEDTIEPLLPWASTSSWPVGKTLMEQSKIAGIGNVYRAEILFMLGLNPWKLTKDLTREEWEQVWQLSRVLLTAGVQHKGGITTTLRTLPKPATLPPHTHCASRTYVYKRTGQPCVSCGTLVRQEEFAGRTLYWCPTCQA